MSILNARFRLGFSDLVLLNEGRKYHWTASFATPTPKLAQQIDAPAQSTTSWSFIYTKDQTDTGGSLIYDVAITASDGHTKYHLSRDSAGNAKLQDGPFKVVVGADPANPNGPQNRLTIINDAKTFFAINAFMMQMKH